MPGTLQELDAYLQSEGNPADSMMLSDLDGFLTGVACAPVPVANWADVAFGAGVPPGVMRLTRKRLDDITASMSAETGLLEPIFWQSPEGHAIAMDWCEVFMEAVKFNTVHWDKFAQSTTGAKLFMPILVYMFDDSGNSLFGIAQEDVDETPESAAETIPQTVPLIYREMQMSA